jgi:internalin A
MKLGQMRWIERLKLRHTRTDDDVLQAIAGCPFLKILELDGTAITDDGIAELIAGCPRVCRISLSGTRITDQTCLELTKVRSLLFVDLSGTEVTSAGVQQLQQAFPQCQIHTD